MKKIGIIFIMFAIIMFVILLFYMVQIDRTVCAELRPSYRAFCSIGVISKAQPILLYSTIFVPALFGALGTFIISESGETK